MNNTVMDDEAVIADRTLCVFRLNYPNASAVSLIGSFNRWSTTAHPMKVTTGKWETSVALQPGQHKYAYFVLVPADLSDTNGRRFEAFIVNIGAEIDVKGSPKNQPAISPASVGPYLMQ